MAPDGERILKAVQLVTMVTDGLFHVHNILFQHETTVVQHKNGGYKSGKCKITLVSFSSFHHFNLTISSFQFVYRQKRTYDSLMLPLFNTYMSIIDYESIGIVEKMHSIVIYIYASQDNSSSFFKKEKLPLLLTRLLFFLLLVSLD